MARVTVRARRRDPELRPNLLARSREALREDFEVLVREAVVDPHHQVFVGGQAVGDGRLNRVGCGVTVDARVRDPQIAADMLAGGGDPLGADLELGVRAP